MRKKLTVIGALVAIFALMIGGATFALFTDTATNSNSELTAGNVDIACSRNNGDGHPGPMFYSTAEQGEVGGADINPTGENIIGLWAPGDSHSRYLNLQNTGSLAAKISKVTANITNSTALSATEYDEFSQMMNVQILYKWDTAQEKVLYDGPLAGLLNGWVDIPAADIPVLASGCLSEVLKFTCSLDIEAGNDIQGISPVVDFSIYAEQYKNNN